MSHHTDHTPPDDATEQAATDEHTSPDETPQLSRGKKMFLAGVGVFVTMGLAAGTAWFLEYPLKERQAAQDLQNVFESRSDIVHFSTSVHDYPDTESTVPQQRLGIDGEPLDSAQFVFGTADSDDAQRFDVTVSFGEQRSMDFLRMNSSSLQHLVMNNVVTLHIHTAPSAQNPYSILAPEALALAVAENPDVNVWNLMMHLVRLSVQVADEQETDPEVLAEKIAEIMQHEGVDVSAADIRKGVFAEWIHHASSQVADDSYGLPILTLDNERISPENVDILNPEAFSNHIWSKAIQE